VLNVLADGTGSGPINQRSLQIPALIKLSLHEKQAIALGEGKGTWNHVHISDVAAFYNIVLRRFLSEKSVDTGKEGFYFLEAGEMSWMDISKAIGAAGVTQGLWKEPQPKAIPPQDMSDKLGVAFLDAEMVEVI
jgi:hypothetical protein